MRHRLGHRTEQSACDRIDADVADDEQIGVDVVDQVDEHVDRGPRDSAFFDVLRARGPCPVGGVAKHRVHRRTALGPVVLALELIGLAGTALVLGQECRDATMSFASASAAIAAALSTARSDVSEPSVPTTTTL